MFYCIWIFLQLVSALPSPPYQYFFVLSKGRDKKTVTFVKVWEGGCSDTPFCSFLKKNIDQIQTMTSEPQNLLQFAKTCIWWQFLWEYNKNHVYFKCQIFVLFCQSENETGGGCKLRFWQVLLQPLAIFWRNLYQLPTIYFWSVEGQA